MLIALPPSQGKTAPQSGPPLDLDSMSIPPFTALRRELVRELEEVSKLPSATDLLGVGARVEHEVHAQRNLTALPCAPAYEVYTGVLYQAADFSTLSDAARARADDEVLIFSALFGAVSPRDLIPRYRLTMGVKLPGGTPASRWRPLWRRLDERADGQLVIDGRSADYAAWKPPVTAVRVAINAVRDTNGQRKVITHNAKHYRGLIARIALEAETPPRTADDLAHEASRVGTVELTGSGNSFVLTVVESSL